MDSREIFSKIKLNRKQLVIAICTTFEVVEEDILFIGTANDWLKKEKQLFIIEYNGKLDSDDDEYPGYHYYDIWYENKEHHNKLKKLENSLGKDVVVTID